MSDRDFFTAREIWGFKAAFVGLGLLAIFAFVHAAQKGPGADAWLNLAGIVLAVVAALIAAFVALRASGRGNTIRRPAFPISNQPDRGGEKAIGILERETDEPGQAHPLDNLCESGQPQSMRTSKASIACSILLALFIGALLGASLMANLFEVKGSLFSVNGEKSDWLGFWGALVGAGATISAGWLALRGVRGQIDEMRLTRWIEFVNSEREQAEKELPGLREALTFLDKAINIPDEQIETWSIKTYANEFMQALGFPDSEFSHYDCDWDTLIAAKIPNAPEHYKIEIGRALYDMYNIDELPGGSTSDDIDAAEEINFQRAMKRITEIHGSIESDISGASDAIIRQREKSRELREELRKRHPE